MAFYVNISSTGDSYSSKPFSLKLIYLLYTYVGESQLTWLANSSQETAPIGTYDTPLDSSYRGGQPRGMRFPEFFAPCE